MDPKSTLVKSKSSNSAISRKSEDGSKRQCNKATRSNANFPCHGLKKRGMYVEKRLTKINLANNGKEVDCITQKPPPRPRPGQKRFLASVLTILSKSTTGTQYPELDDTKERNHREKDKNKMFVKQKSFSDEDRIKEKDTKEKFKSRVLNKKFVREDKKKMVVLQSKKEIAQTPSNYSEWSYKDASQYSNFSNLMICEDSNKDGFDIADELKNAVLEGRNVKLKKLRYLEDEPKTLVSDGPKDQKNLYNFFVDLLETTISVYNVKAEYDAAAPTKASGTHLQINESVANKLNIGKVKKGVEFDDGIVSPQYLHYVQNETDYDTNVINNNIKPITMKPLKRETPIKSSKIKKMNADSFLYANNFKPVPQKSKSVEINRKTTFKNKNDLMNVLKQELQIDTNTFEEPKSIFQALRVMVRNKKKITFDPSLDHKSYTDECVLKRRKVISSRKIKKNNKDRAIKNVKSKFNITDYARNTRKAFIDASKREDSEIDASESCHSLEVYGFDYEPKTPKKIQYNKAKDITLTYHSSNSELNFDLKDVILNPNSTLSSIQKFSAAID